jgi:hypothetical protein
MKDMTIALSRIFIIVPVSNACRYLKVTFHDKQLLSVLQITFYFIFAREYILTEMSTRNLASSKTWLACKAEHLTAISESLTFYGDSISPLFPASLLIKSMYIQFLTYERVFRKSVFLRSMYLVTIVYWIDYLYFINWAIRAPLTNSKK